ncbi:MAG: glycosyltransferase family 25 protein [Muribaculum sp.]|nr:glycosyltransferase family 25 protein [Muribaculum sp.]
MNKLKTYIVNLESAHTRHRYMEEILSPYDLLDVEFVAAIDGRKMSRQLLRQIFDYDECMKLIGRNPNDGEVGATLSHRMVYERLLNSSLPYALILEDDISIMRDLNELKNYNIDALLDIERPRILLLSGDYWYWKRKEIVSVFDCVGSYAYFINRSAAKLILSTAACCVADYWTLYKSNGIEIHAILPYMVDANLKMDILPSCVEQYSWTINRRKMSKKNVALGLVNGIVKRVLKYAGHFENKIWVTTIK